MSTFNATNYKIDGKLIPILDRIVVKELFVGERTTKEGIVIPDDDGKERGIRPRWGQVYAIGKDQNSVEVGQWILVDHGRWTRGIKIEDSDGQHTIRMVDPDDVLLISDEKPGDEDL